MVPLVTTLQPSQNRERVLNRRLPYHNRLESSLQRGVFFDVLAVLVERGRADAFDVPSRQGGLEQVRRVRAPLVVPRADDRVQLVDEQDHVPEGVFDFLKNRLEPLFELASEFRARDQRAHVERDDLFVLQRLGDVPLDDSEREPLDDRGLSDARLSDEDGVVFGSSGKDLDRAPNFGVSPDHGVELSFSGAIDQIDPVFFEGLQFSFRVGVGHAMVPPNFTRALEDFRSIDGEQVEKSLRGAVDLGQREQEMLGRNILVPEGRRLFGRLHKDFLEFGGDRRIRPLNARKSTDFRVDRLFQTGFVGAERFQYRRDVPVSLFEQGAQQVEGAELGIRVGDREALRPREHFLRFCREFILREIHRLPPYAARVSERPRTKHAKGAPIKFLFQKNSRKKALAEGANRGG